jgi:RND family efflux transporter MFP subunit
LACKAKHPESSNPQQKRQYLQEKNPVEVAVLERGTFKNQLVENGKLYAIRKSDLRFGAEGELEGVYVKNGEQVSKGQLIARLRQEELHQDLDQNRLELDKARLELQDILIGQGYDLNDTLRIPPDVMEVAKIRSGYAGSAMDKHQAETKLKASELRAPFTGIVANIEHKAYEQAGTSEEFCTLIDNSMFEVEFASLETEIQALSLGKAVTITPFSLNRTYQGKITEINPIIDENGLIKVKATLKGTQGLMDGMNVKVFIETSIPNQLVVPRSAVVLRDNQEVLFKYISGKAFWTYVQVLAENSTSYSIKAHPDKGGTLVPGDTIITSGNLNLAHESEVAIIK